MNESIYYSVDEIHNAIINNRKIRFKYFSWQPDKSQYILNGGNWFTVSPWALTWDDENYYLIAFDEEAGKIKHFRVDKIKNVRILDKKRVGRDEFKEFDMAKYAKMSFGMFGGEETKVKLAFEDDMVGVFLDRFGKDITIFPDDKKGWSLINVDVAVSDQFLGWIFALGPKVRIVGPAAVTERFAKELETLKKLYK
jgi:predicted DNA-binding transcriptional regulator YafY